MKKNKINEIVYFLGEYLNSLEYEKINILVEKESIEDIYPILTKKWNVEKRVDFFLSLNNANFLKTLNYLSISEKDEIFNKIDKKRISELFLSSNFSSQNILEEDQINSIFLFKYLVNNPLKKELNKINEIFEKVPPSKIHDQIEEWNKNEILDFFELLDSENSAIMFLEFDSDDQIELLEGFSDNKTQEIFSNLHTDEAVDILEEIPYKIIQKILSKLDTETRIKINKIFRYAKNQCGFHMAIDYIAIENNQLVKAAKRKIKSDIKNKDLEIIGNIFVVNNQNKLLGFIKIDDFFVADDNEKIDTLFKVINSAKVTDDLSVAEKIMNEYDVPTAPIVNSNGQLVGVIESEDIIERYEDMEDNFLFREATVNSSKKEVEYLKQSVFDIFKSRVWWIVVLLFVGGITQIIISGFQLIWVSNGIWGSGSSDVGTVMVSSIVTLGLMTSLSVASSINDTAGNSSSQVSSTLIRSLAIGEVNSTNYWLVFKKEFYVSILLGLSAAVASFVRIFIVWGLMNQFSHIPSYSTELNVSELTIIGWYVVIALIASITYFISVVVGNVIGVALPMYSVRKGKDGAIVSGPVQTTIIDVVVFTIYLTLTTAIFVPLVVSGYFIV